MITKTYTIIYILTASLALSSAASAQGGSSKGGGGGNVRGSSSSDVRAAIEQVTFVPTIDGTGQERDVLAAKNNIFSAVYYLHRSIAQSKAKKSTHPVRDSKLALIFDRMLGLDQSYSEDPFTSPIYLDLLKTNFLVQDQPCKVPGEARTEASSTEKKPGAPICLSIEALKSIPQSSLEIQLRALIAHEVSHHFGYGELEANRVQDYFLFSTINTVDQSIVIQYLLDTMAAISVASREILQNINLAQRGERGLSDTEVCPDIGRIMESAVKLEHLLHIGAATSSSDDSIKFFSGRRESIEEVRLRSYNLRTFCQSVSRFTRPGDSGWMHEQFPTVTRGNRTELSVALNELATKINVLREQLMQSVP